MGSIISNGGFLLIRALLSLMNLVPFLLFVWLVDAYNGRGLILVSKGSPQKKTGYFMTSCKKVGR